MNDFAMKIITDINEYIPEPCAATIGSFDGVHLGHRSILDELREAASADGLPIMVLTFARHPRLVFGCDAGPFLLSSREGKIALLESLGVDILVMLDLDTYMASMSAERFMREVLLERLGVCILAVGYDHHFGKPCITEGIREYILYGKKLGIDVFRASPFAINGKKVSSSEVRQTLLDGDVETAALLLGRRYSISGKVVHCAGIGHTLGFPTANITPSCDMLIMPKNGVYEVDAIVEGKTYKGVMNIGVKPTVNSDKIRSAEVHIIDFSGDIYGKSISVSFVRRLRDEAHFDSLESLRAQIELDVEKVKNKMI